jgi:hypothetical protein
MSDANLLESVAGLLLVFFVPGFAVTKALYPEWRVRGAAALRRLVEITTLSFVLSVVLTVLVGYFLLAFAPGGFQAAWSDPVLELVLVGITVVAVVVGWVRGSFRREPPLRAAAPDRGGEEGAWELTRRLDLLGREERRVRHLLRTGPRDPAERDRLNARLEELRSETDELTRRREAEYAE